jgi:heme-degrading monooxygenase HmoA
MTQILVRHKVNDFDKWKQAFDNFVDQRKLAGEKAYRIWRPENDADNLHLFFEWDTPENAQRFFESDDLKDAMKRAGVAEEPDIKFMNEADQGTL